MKLSWPGFTLGGGPKFFLDNEQSSLNGQLENIVVDVPRTDYTKNVFDFIPAKIFNFTGVLVGSDTEDFRIEKQNLANELRDIHTFTLIDNVVNTNHWYSPFNTDWRKRIKITVGTQGSPLVDQDVFVDLSLLPASFFSDILSDGADIVVTASDSITKLERLLENLNIGGQSGDLYFTAPSLSDTTTTDFFIYYNNVNGAEINDGTKVSPVSSITIHGIEDFDPSKFGYTFAQYEFEGKIVVINTNDDVRSSRSRYQIQIASPDPFLKQLPDTIQTASITLSGFIYPKIYPHVYGGGGNSITVTNSGGVDAYPTIVLTGGFNDITIRAENVANNNLFTLSKAVASNDFVTITPIPNDAIKIRDSSGNSLIQFTNSNFDILKLVPGSNTFTFFTSGGIDGNTQVSFTFNNTFISI